MESVFTTATLWLALAVVAALLASSLRLSVALVEICVGVMAAGIYCQLNPGACREAIKNGIIAAAGAITAAITAVKICTQKDAPFKSPKNDREICFSGCYWEYYGGLNIITPGQKQGGDVAELVRCLSQCVSEVPGPGGPKNCWHAAWASLKTWESGLMASSGPPMRIDTAPLPENVGSGMFTPCSRMHWANFSARSWNSGSRAAAPGPSWTRSSRK